MNILDHIKSAIFGRTEEANRDKWHEEVRARWDAERKEKSEKEAVGKSPTHIVEWNNDRFEVYYTNPGDFVRVDTGENLGGRWKGPRVIEILGLTEEQRRTKADMLALFGKMVASDRVASTEAPIGMGHPAPALQTYLRYMEKGPMMHIWFYALYLDYKKVCELTDAENDRMVAAIKNRDKKPELNPKEIEELL